MTDSKAWHLSPTIWSAALAVRASLAGLAGLDLTAPQQAWSTPS